MTRIFVAGSTGVIGRLLVPALVGAGHHVVALIRSPLKSEGISSAGAEPVLCDVFDTAKLTKLMHSARAELVIHELTDLGPSAGSSGADDALERNAKMRIEGTQSLVRAALVSKTSRMIAQSVAWAYAPGNEPHSEDDPLDLNAVGSRAMTVRGVVALEAAVLNTPGIDGVVLRYGRLHGPATGNAEPVDGMPPLHIATAIAATVAAVARAAPGVYNIVDANRRVSGDKARAELCWLPIFESDR